MKIPEALELSGDYKRLRYGKNVAIVHIFWIEAKDELHQ
jgi:hypothetical protein